jgi:hypothetical protein
MTTLAKDWTTYYETDYDMEELNIQMEKVLALSKFETTDEKFERKLRISYLSSGLFQRDPLIPPGPHFGS